MSLKDQLVEDMKTAMKAKDTVKLGVIRVLRSEIRNFEIDNGEQDDAGVMKVLQRQVKQIKESIEEYSKAGRDDLVSEEEAKLAVVEAYLPEQMSDEEVIAIIDEVLAAAEDTSSVGPLIGQVMAKVNGLADGKRVSALVMQQLKK
jgi:uncharacterized protein YqeY